MLNLDYDYKKLLEFERLDQLRLKQKKKKKRKKRKKVDHNKNFDVGAFQREQKSQMKYIERKDEFEQEDINKLCKKFGNFLF